LVKNPIVISTVNVAMLPFAYVINTGRKQVTPECKLVNRFSITMPEISRVRLGYFSRVVFPNWVKERLDVLKRILLVTGRVPVELGYARLEFVLVLQD
jgi:hypothetical protein